MTQVNEMLTWMENHPLPFVCTTNLIDRLDVASLRRFTFKIDFDYLGPGQIREAFRYFFALDPPPVIERLPMLTPGDFQVVRKKAEVMGELSNSRELGLLLDDEVKSKYGSAKKIIGFER